MGAEFTLNTLNTWDVFTLLNCIIFLVIGSQSTTTDELFTPNQILLMALTMGKVLLSNIREIFRRVIQIFVKIDCSRN